MAKSLRTAEVRNRLSDLCPSFFAVPISSARQSQAEHLSEGARSVGSRSVAVSRQSRARPQEAMDTDKDKETPHLWARGSLEWEKRVRDAKGGKLKPWGHSFGGKGFHKASPAGKAILRLP